MLHSASSHQQIEMTVAVHVQEGRANIISTRLRRTKADSWRGRICRRTGARNRASWLPGGACHDKISLKASPFTSALAIAGARPLSRRGSKRWRANSSKRRSSEVCFRPCAAAVFRENERWDALTR